MRELIFFIKNIFLKKWVLIIGFLVIIIIANYLTFTASRSLISTYQGYKDSQFLYQDDIYISNLDPDVPQNFEDISIEETQSFYDYLNQNTEFAVESFGFSVNLPNEDNMDILVNYINENAYNLRDTKLSGGSHLEFDNDKKITEVLVGKALAEDYPVGTNFEIINPVTQENENLIVSGILQTNEARSNLYAPNSKNYFNYAIFYPINYNFIKKSNLDLQVNALNDLILLESSKEEAGEVKNVLKTETGLSFNFFSQQDNFSHFEEYYRQSVKIIILFTFITIFIAVLLAIWITLISIRLTIKDFTINLLVGLSYNKLRFILYQYFSILFTISLILLMVFISINRYSSFISKDSIFTTFGFLGLIGMDWSALSIVFFSNIIIEIAIVEFMMKKIKNIPISLGVLT